MNFSLLTEQISELVVNIDSWLIAKTLCILLFLWLINSIFYQPLKGLYFYSSQNKNIKCHFFPVLGVLKKFKDVQISNKDQLHWYKETMKENPNTVAFASTLGNRMFIDFSDPDHIKDMLLNKHEKSDKVHDFIFFRDFFAKGLLFTSGNRWKRERKMLGANFNYDKISKLLPEIQEICNQRWEELAKEIEASPEKEIPVNIVKLCASVIGDVMIVGFFGKDIGKYTINGKRLGDEIKSIIDGSLLHNMDSLYQLKVFLMGPVLSEKYLLTGTMKDLYPRMKAYKELVTEIIKERIKTFDKSKLDTSENNYGSLLDVYLSHYLSDNNSKKNEIDFEEILHQFCSFFMVGVDTAAHLPSMTMYELAKSPEIKQKLIEEHKEMIENFDNITKEDIKNLEFNKACFNETLRFNTPVQNTAPRAAIVDHMVGGVKVRKGDMVSVSYMAAMHNPKYFPEPEKFDPNRWLDNKKMDNIYSYMPFSAGPRNCIGQHLAILEGYVILISFLNKFDIRINDKVELVRTILFTYTPQDDALILVKNKK